MQNTNAKREQELKDNGFDLEAFIAMGLPSGSKVTINLPNGGKQEIEVVLEKLENMDAIRQDPYYSRWTMAQVFRVLRDEKSVTEYLKGKFSHPYRYQFTQTLERLREIEKLPVNSDRAKALGHFFTRRVATELAREYLTNLHSYINGLPVRSHRGEPYVKVPRYGNVHVKDIEGVVFRSLESALDRMETASYWSLISFNQAFYSFIRNMVKFDDHALKLNPRFIAAYQGRGAYLTVTGLIQFHGCRVFTRKPSRYSWMRGEKDVPMSKAESLAAVDEKATEIIRDASRYYRCTPDWYKLWGFMKEVVEDNGFNFYATMAKKYNR